MNWDYKLEPDSNRAWEWAWDKAFDLSDRRLREWAEARGYEEFADEEKLREEYAEWLYDTLSDDWHGEDD